MSNVARDYEVIRDFLTHPLHRRVYVIVMPYIILFYTSLLIKVDKITLKI